MGELGRHVAWHEVALSSTELTFSVERANFVEPLHQLLLTHVRRLARQSLHAVDQRANPARSVVAQRRPTALKT